MGFLGDIAGGVVSGTLKVFPQIATAVGNVIIGVKQNEAAREGQQDADGVKLASEWVTSVNNYNAVKAEHETERSAMRAFLLFALPVGILWWAGLLDSIPWHLPYMEPHKVGSWGVDIPPKFEDDFHYIVRSFFYAAPALAGVAVLAKAFRRK